MLWINLDKGLYVFKDHPTLYAKSMRQYKILNSESHYFTHVPAISTLIFGDGIRTAPKRQSPTYYRVTATIFPLYFRASDVCEHVPPEIKKSAVDFDRTFCHRDNKIAI